MPKYSKDEMEEFKEDSRNLLLEEYPNFHSLTRQEQIKIGEEILDRILVGARKWQDPELNSASAAPLGRAIEKFAMQGKELMDEWAAQSNKH